MTIPSQMIVAPLSAPDGEAGILRISTETSCIVAGNNGTTAFGRVAPLTPLARLASGKYRPAGILRATAAGSSVNVVTLDSVATLFVGDVVTLFEDDGTPRAETRTVSGITGLVATLSGGTFSPEVGDYVTVDAAASPAGLLMGSILTTTADAPAGEDQPAAMLVDGAVVTARCVGCNALTQAALAAQTTHNIIFR